MGNSERQCESRKSIYIFHSKTKICLDQIGYYIIKYTLEKADLNNMINTEYNSNLHNLENIEDYHERKHLVYT